MPSLSFVQDGNIHTVLKIRLEKYYGTADKDSMPEFLLQNDPLTVNFKGDRNEKSCIPESF
jgi:hypothetical protein